MSSAYITHSDCARHSMGADHPECAARLGAINDHLLVKGLLDHMIEVDAPLASEAQLARAQHLRGVALPSVGLAIEADKTADQQHGKAYIGVDAK